MTPPRWNLRREPLAHFALGAAVIFALERVASRSPPSPRPRIAVSAASVASLRADFEAQRGRPATADDEAAIVAEYVRDEALAREALARHLDVGDAVIRRRLVQKMQFLLDAQPVDEPDDATLTRWLAAHADAFRHAPSVSFELVLFARDRRDASAALDARNALAAMSPDEPADRAALRGDPSPRGATFAAMRFADVTAMFGYDMARALDALPMQRWQGPLEGPEGWYLARVTRRDPGGTPPLETVRAEVRRRWVEERRAELAREATERIVRRYEVVR